MDSQYLQRLRFQLQQRVRRLNSCNHQFFHSAVVQFWKYCNEQPHIAGILARLEAEVPEFEDEVKSAFSGDQIVLFDTELEQLGFTYRLIKHCCSQPLSSGGNRVPELLIGRAISHSSKFDECVEAFRQEYLEPFYEFIDNALDQQTAVLSLLLKYKKKVEWFERELLAEKAGKDERQLAQHLYAFLLDQGLDFHIEPQSASGEADLVSPDLILDAKVFDGDRRGKRYIADGVHQVHTYTRDFNQEVGYLVIYKTCPETIHFSLGKENFLVPYISVGGKIIYLMVVDLCDYGASASKRGKLRTFEVTEEFLIQPVASLSDEAGTSTGATTDNDCQVGHAE